MLLLHGEETPGGNRVYRLGDRAAYTNPKGVQYNVRVYTLCEMKLHRYVYSTFYSVLICSDCGSDMVRTGSTFRCGNCGATGGCS